MPETLPLFPLSTVLMPGASLPLHVFEPRYRQLTVDLMTEEIPGHCFGVVAIREGVSGELHNTRQLHEFGCSALLRDVRKLPDGRFDIITTGERRFRLLDVDSTSAPYVVGTVEWEPDTEPVGRAQQALPDLAAAARCAHRRYCEAAWRREDWSEFDAELEPGMLANQLAADCLLSLPDKQLLLEERCPAKRLGTLRRMLNRERGVVANLRAIPVPLAQLGPAASTN